MEASYQGELPECSSFDSRAGINTLLGCRTGTWMEMTQAESVPKGNFLTEDAT